MKRTNIDQGFFRLIVLFLFVTACSGGLERRLISKNTGDTPDSGPSLPDSMTNLPDDSGQGNMTGRDAMSGSSDSGIAVTDGGLVFPDATIPDSGMMNSGVCPPNYPGCRCSNPNDPMGMAMEPAQGTCVDPASVCGPYDVDPQSGLVTLGICVFLCRSDTDCAGKRVGNPSDNKLASICRNVGDDGRGICVEREKADDERCRLHALAGRSMEGCRRDAVCFRLDNDSPGEGTCLQECTPSPSDPSGGCTGTYTYCNPRVFNRNGNPVGICSDRARSVGSRCGGGYTKQCDTGAGEIFCYTNEMLDPNGQNPPFFTLGLDEGFCVEQCDPDAPSCPGTTDPNLGPGKCISLGTGSQGKLGLCSHECNKLTDEGLQDISVNNCTGAGSLGNGRNCFAMPSLTINQGPVTAQADICFDVQGPVTAEAQVVAQMNPSSMNGFVPKPAPGTMPADCAGSRSNGELFSCPTGTYCANLGSQQAPVPGCLRNCTTFSTVAQPPYQANECADSTLMNGSSLVCVPYTKTSPDPIMGPWFGFCAPAPN